MLLCEIQYVWFTCQWRSIDIEPRPSLGPVNTNDDVVAAAPNKANQGARREVWWFQMNAEQRRVASFGAQPVGIGHFSVLLHYRKLMCSKHTSLAKPCRNKKMAESTPAELVLTGPKNDFHFSQAWESSKL